MAERFRFRLPWLTAQRAIDEEQQPPRPPVETQPPPPVRPAATIPIQRPPFRPAGIAPAQTQPRTTESQPAALPSRAATQPASVPPPPRAESQATTSTESQVAIQTRSPPRAGIRTQTTSVPPSPSRVGSQSRSASLPASPSRAAPQSGGAPVPSSPSRASPQVKPARQTSPQPQPSPRLATQRVDQTSTEHSSPSEMANQAQPTVSSPSAPRKLQSTPQEPTSDPSPQSDTRLVASLLVPEAPQLKTETASVIEPVSISQNQTEPSQAPTVQTASASAFRQVLETPAAYQRSDFAITNADHSAKLPQPLKMETEEGKKVAEQNGSATEGKNKREATFGGKKKTVFSSSREQEQVRFTTTRNTMTQSHLNPVTTTGGKAHLHREIREDVSRFVQKMEAGYPMHQPNGENPVSIVTLAGENKGATMHLGTESARKEEPVHILRGYKLNPYDSTDATSDGEGMISKGRKPEDELTKDEPTTKAYINSNLQSINNSIVFESSLNERNPGVQLTISQQPTAPASSSAKPGRLETRKAEFNIIPAEKHTYEPVVRRRCLRGLLLESSDSDPGNPEKPRRHGCRYSCGEKSKDKDIGVF